MSSYKGVKQIIMLDFHAIGTDIEFLFLCGLY